MTTNTSRPLYDAVALLRKHKHRLDSAEANEVDRLIMCAMMDASRSESVARGTLTAAQEDAVIEAFKEQASVGSLREYHEDLRKGTVGLGPMRRHLDWLMRHVFALAASQREGGQDVASAKLEGWEEAIEYVRTWRGFEVDIMGLNGPQWGNDLLRAMREHRDRDYPPAPAPRECVRLKNADDKKITVLFQVIESGYNWWATDASGNCGHETLAHLVSAHNLTPTDAELRALLALTETTNAR